RKGRTARRCGRCRQRAQGRLKRGFRKSPARECCRGRQPWHLSVESLNGERFDHAQTSCMGSNGCRNCIECPRLSWRAGTDEGRLFYRNRYEGQMWSQLPTRRIGAVGPSEELCLAEHAAE